MGLTVTFELSDSDIEHFRVLLEASARHAAEYPEERVLEDARVIIEKLRGSSAPVYVLERVDKLETLIAMLRDGNWQMDPLSRTKILRTLIYFTKAEDLIPDHIPGLGFLDDAIMIELLVRELQADINAYRDYLVTRAAGLTQQGVG